jgi:hypothetical protein
VIDDARGWRMEVEGKGGRLRQVFQIQKRWRESYLVREGWW